MVGNESIEKAFDFFMLDRFQQKFTAPFTNRLYSQFSYSLLIFNHLRIGQHDNRHFRYVFPDSANQIEAGKTITHKNKAAFIFADKIQCAPLIIRKMSPYSLACENLKDCAGKLGIVIGD